MENRQVEIGKMENLLKAWGAKLDELAERVTLAGDKAKTGERQLLAEMRAKQLLAKRKLDELKAAGGDKWETLKAGVEGAYNELETTFRMLTN